VNYFGTARSPQTLFGWALVRRYLKRVFALKGLNILAQGNALGNTETNTSALKGRDIGYTLMFGPYIPPFQG
jgi:hypothetical protein